MDSLFLYEGIAEGLAGMGIPREKVSYPTWNCVDHIRLHPEPKGDVVTFAGRAFAFKNPELMLRAIELVHSEAPCALATLGKTALPDGVAPPSSLHHVSKPGGP